MATRKKRNVIEERGRPRREVLAPGQIVCGEKRMIETARANIGGSYRMVVRWDNSHPNNGTEYSKRSFHCPIVPSDMKNSAGPKTCGIEALPNHFGKLRLGIPWAYGRAHESGRVDEADEEQRATSENGRKYLRNKTRTNRAPPRKTVAPDRITRAQAKFQNNTDLNVCNRPDLR